MKRESHNAARSLSIGADAVLPLVAGKFQTGGEAIAGEDPNQRHFDTAHLTGNLKSRMLSSGFITTSAQGVQFVLNLAAMMVLARLLTPADFGLVAMVTVVTSFLRVFRDVGLSTATVQREGITHAQVSNLFWTNVAVSGLIMVILAAASPAIASFYREPRLVTITLAVSVTFLLTGLVVQHQALLNRQMRFKALAVIDIVSMVASMAVAIGMAWFGCGYWSLVGMSVSAALVRCAMVWMISIWRPQFPKRRSGTRSLLGFGASLTASGFIYSIARGTDSLLLGRFFGADSVGFYTRAGVLLLRPLEQLLGPMSAVFLPVLSRLQTQPYRYRLTFLQMFEVAALASFVGSGMLLPLAKPITLVVLGSQWEQTANIVTAFAFVALFLPLSSVSTWLFNSQGRGRDSLRTSVASSVITAAAFVAGLPFGPVGVALAFAVSGLLVQMPILFFIAGRSGPVSTADLWQAFFRHLPIWGVACGATFLAHALVLRLGPVTQLIVCGPVGLIGVAGFIWIHAPTRRVALSLLSMIQQLKAGRLG